MVAAFRMRPYADRMTRTPRQTLWVSIAGFLAVAMYAAFGAVQILVLNPLAAAPGLTLQQMHLEMSAAGESLNAPSVIAILGLGVALALFVAVGCLLGRVQPTRAAAAFLLLLMLGVPAYFVASFGPGMSLADAFGISGADASPWALPLYAVSALAMFGFAGLLIWEALRPRPKLASV